MGVVRLTSHPAAKRRCNMQKQIGWKSAADGMIAIQMHYTDAKTPRWVDGGFWRWRVIAVKELPAQ